MSSRRRRAQESDATGIQYETRRQHIRDLKKISRAEAPARKWIKQRVTVGKMMLTRWRKSIELSDHSGGKQRLAAGAASSMAGAGGQPGMDLDLQPSRLDLSGPEDNHMAVDAASTPGHTPAASTTLATAPPKDSNGRNSPGAAPATAEAAQFGDGAASPADAAKATEGDAEANFDAADPPDGAAPADAAAVATAQGGEAGAAKLAGGELQPAGSLVDAEAEVDAAPSADLATLPTGAAKAGPAHGNDS